MVQDLFDSILKDLSEVLKINELKLDSARTCLLKLPNGLQIHLEPYDKGDFMLFSANLGELPRGRYRENVLREALKENTLTGSTTGIFGFSEQRQCLILFALMSLREINGEKIASFLYPFMEKAQNWKVAIESGQIPVADRMTTSQTSPMGMFGLRP